MLNTQRIAEILQCVVIPCIKAVANSIFQQNNTRPYAAHQTLDFLQDAGLEWRMQ